MTENDFWELIKKSKKKSKGDPEEQILILVEELKGKSAEDIVAFDHHLSHFRTISYNSSLWCVGFIALGGCSDDGFEYFRCWLIAQGKEVFENALENPDSLVTILDPLTESDSGPELEEMLYIATDAYSQKFGLSYDEGMEQINELTWKLYPESTPYPEIDLEWNEGDEESMKRICPNICKKYWT